MILPDIVTNDTLKNLINYIGFAISIFLLFIHIKNSRIQRNSFWLARDSQRSSSIDLVYISSMQLDKKVSLKLVLFNPSSTSAIIKSFAIYKQIPSRNILLRLFNKKELERIENARWWPTKHPEDRTMKYLADEYQNLLVKDQRDILVLFPGEIDRNYYCFEIKTNHGDILRHVDIYGTNTCFPHASSIKYTD